MKHFFQKTKSLLQIIVVALAVWFVAKVLLNNWQNLKEFDWQFNWFFLSVSILLHAVSFTILGLAWQQILVLVSGMKLNSKKVWRIFFISQIVRYIPGNIWSFISLGMLNEQHLGVRKSHTLLAIILEVALRMAIGALISVLVLIEVFHQYSYFYYLVLLLITCTIVLVVFNQKFLNRILNWILRKKGENFISQIEFTPKMFFKISWFFALHWLVYGIGLYFLILALGIDQVSLGKAIGVDILSWIVGYLSLLTPSGVGVREAAMIALLTPYIHIALATIISLLARLLFTLGEVINLGLVYLLTREK